MNARDEVKRLLQKLEDGSLPPDEPLFVLRAQDITAPIVVNTWAMVATLAGSPRKKCKEAYDLAGSMTEWPTRGIPGRPQTRQTLYPVNLPELYQNLRPTPTPPESPTSLAHRLQDEFYSTILNSAKAGESDEVVLHSAIEALELVLEDMRNRLAAYEDEQE